MKEHNWFGSMTEATAEGAIHAIMQAHEMGDYRDAGLKEQWRSKVIVCTKPPISPLFFLHPQGFDSGDKTN
jgi:hypothetical protein